ncbi:hypothetical protein [Cohnella sp. REN36]|uniref:hypothetical protein n=1 Tax=Cohnella sp. REN36 TaxID=2887347 RepID=UPI001D149CA8|nr:hypothetical protein [Cohnella sp. REN36]MCC3375849.1 hypothetical protein [Cohnella sp. REN36]
MLLNTSKRRLTVVLAGIALFASAVPAYGETTAKVDGTAENAAQTATVPTAWDMSGTHFIFGDIVGEKLKRLSVKGTSKVATVSTQVGELKNDYRVRTLEGKGSELSFQLSDLTPNKTLTLELEEIHTRSDDTMYYSIYVNGQKVYVRTYSEVSEGPNHYFVQIPASVVGNRNSVAVKLHNEGGARINFGRVWAYSDFENMLASQHVGGQMAVGLFQPNLKWDDYASDLALLKQLKTQYSNYSMYKPSVAFDIYYMHWSEEKTKSRLKYLMNLSHDSGLALNLSINSWWSGTPGGPDGKGELWGDIPYNQVVYDPLNVDGRGNWKLSTPNIWGSTPWLTMNDEHYNQVRADKVKDITSYISTKSAEMKLEGKPVPTVSIFTENEPLYWPYFAFNASPDAGADFSPLVIAAAAKDGVTLDPEDGLSDKEKDWLSNHLTSYISQLSRSIADGYGYNAVTVDNGNVSLPDTQLVEKAYTHMFVMPNYPNWDEKKAAWETHMVNGIRYGAEWAGDLDPRYLDYIIARGKFSDVNAERSSISDMATLEKAYMAGADYVNIYNFRDGDQRLIQSFDGKSNELVPTASYGQTFLDYDFAGEDSLNTNATLIGAEHVKRDALNGYHIVTADNGDPGGGTLTYKLDHQGIPLTNGAAVEIEGRALSDLNANCKVEVWAGPSPDQLKLVKTLKNFSDEKVDITDAIDRASDTAYLQLKLFSTGLSSSLYSWTSVWNVKAESLWDQKSGHTNGFQYTEAQTRERNQWIAYRADVERMLEDYKERAGADATYTRILAQYLADRYATAYAMLTQELSQTLPAKFAVKGNGALGRYPVSLKVTNPDEVVNAVLYEADETVSLSLKAENATAVTATLTGLRGAYYKAVDEGNGSFSIVRATGKEATAVKVQGGRAAFVLNAADETAKRYPQHFEASYVSIDQETKQAAPEGYLYIRSQDPAVGEYVNFVQLKLAENAVIVRGSDGASDDKLKAVPAAMLFDGDKLDITMNDRNEAVLVKAYYGKEAGKIASVSPISIQGKRSDAFIQLEGQEPLEIGSEAVFDSPKATGTNIFTARVDDLGFRPGDEVTVYYSPYTYQGSSKRALRIAEVFDTLTSETFENDDWSDRIYRAANVKVVPLDTNYKNKVVRPDDISAPGELEWKLDSVTPFTDLTIQYSGRAIMGSDQSVKWYVSDNETNWKEVGVINQQDGNDGNFNLLRSIALQDEVKGLNTVYVKCVLKTSTNDTWASVNDVKIVKKASARDLSSATLSLGDGALAVGQSVPLNVDAVFDNGDQVSVGDVKTVYVIGDPSIATIENRKVKLLKPGATTIQAYLSEGGVVVQSNVLPIVVTDGSEG